MRILGSILLWLAVYTAHAQSIIGYNNRSYNNAYNQFSTAHIGGYSKVNPRFVCSKQMVRANCSSNFRYNNDTLNCAAVMARLSDDSLGCVLFMYAQDSSMVMQAYNIDYYQQSSNASCMAINGRRQCSSCRASANPSFTETYRRMWNHPIEEFVVDTFVKYYAPDTSTNGITTINPALVDTSKPSFYIFHKGADVLDDSAFLFIKNLVNTVPAAHILAHHDRGFRYASIFYSRVYRFSSYSSINSPEETNKKSIVAIQGVPYTYSFGYVDKENDSIRVTPLQTRISRTSFHPNHSCSPSRNTHYYIPRTYEQYIKRALKDSVQDLAYKPGYTPSNPFGPGSQYSLDPTTGDISFTAQDTGIYFLAYTVTEYRDGLPLGDIMVHRIAYVIPPPATAYTLPTINHPTQITPNASYDTTAKLMTTYYVCNNSSIGFTVNAGSTLSGSNIVLSTSLGGVFSGATVNYTGQGTQNPSLRFTWAPRTAGTHYVNITAIDTACGAGHVAVGVTRTIRIVVKDRIKIGFKDSIICKNRNITLYMAQGGELGTPTWSVVPGGDPQLGCNPCNPLYISPDSTTKYVAAISYGGCTYYDTATISVRKPATVSSIYHNNIVGYYTFSSNAQNATVYRWSFGDGGTDTIANPSHYYTANGTYTARLIVSNECPENLSDTVTTTVQITGLGISGTANTAQVQVYPNPAKDDLVITADAAIKEVLLYDNLGRLVASVANDNPIDKKIRHINVAQLPIGLYRLRVVTNGGVAVRTVQVIR